MRLHIDDRPDDRPDSRSKAGAGWIGYPPLGNLWTKGNDKMTDKEILQRTLDALNRVMSHGSAVQDAKNILIAALEKLLAQPQRTHWEGCEEVHPECKQPQPVAHVYRFEPNGRPVIAWDDARNIKVGDKLYKLES